MTEGTLRIRTAAGERDVRLADYLTAEAEEAAHRGEHAWIKQLRHADVDGRPFRERFTARGDSLWWFSEIYLHRSRAILEIHRAIAAAGALIDAERPTAVRLMGETPVARHVVAALAAARGIAVSGGPSNAHWLQRLAALDWRARVLTSSALLARLRRKRTDPHKAVVAAFLHRAFWREGGDDGAAESYVGPALQALEQRLERDAIAYVGVGPATNFRARRWQDRMRDAAGGPRALVPVEQYATSASLQLSRAVWRRRYRDFKAMCASGGMRQAAIVQGVDCWPIVREQLAGIAWLQWPWSARAMDEAGAALDALTPEAVLTYAEAGGWGRALILEARRRGIPSAGLQHGFIYRHWLNYRHEADEMAPAGPGDQGFPAPTLTLLFDDYAGRHLRDTGRFPPDRLAVTGSPRLDSMMRTLASLTGEALAEARRTAVGDAPGHIVLLTTKEREARHVLPALVAAAANIADMLLVIKPHPAETAGAYAAVAGASPRVRIVDAASPLAPLLAVSRAVVTVNSTVALDAAVAGIPALVIGLPNNLSPFVEAGALSGAETTAAIEQALRRILYDEGFRRQLADTRSAFLRAHAIQSDGHAANRTADAVLGLVNRSTAGHS